MGESKTHARNISFRLFLEGIEVDVVTARVQGGMSSPSMAQISIPATDFAHKFLPRTLVHLFYFENKYELGAASVRGEDGTITNQIPLLPDERQRNKDGGKAAKLHDHRDPMNWKLVFSGEIVGYSFAKIGGIRSIKLSCMDFNSYWNMAQMYWGAHSTSKTTFKRAIFVGATRLNYGGKTKITTRDTLVKLMTAKPNGRLQPEGILGGLVSLLESATGVFAPGENGKAHRGVNDMMSYAEMKYHLTRTIGAVESDRTASIFMNSSLFKKWLYNVGRSVKNTATYMQLVQAVLDKVYYQWNSVPVPPYMAGTQKLATTKIETIPTKYKYGSDVSELVKRCMKSHDAIGDVLTSTAWAYEYRRKLAFGFDGAVYAPGLSASTDEQFSGAPLLTPDDAEAAQRQNFNMETKKLSEKTLFATGHIAEWGSQAAITEKGRKAHDDMDKKSKGSSRVRRQADQILEAFETAARAVGMIRRLKNGPQTDRHMSIWRDIRKLLERAAELAGGRLKKPTRTVAGEEIAANTRLIMSLFKPDIYMCPPPKCNVLFPDMIQSINFSRNWMSEVSRLWLSTTYNNGKDRQDVYFAPTTNVMGVDKTSSENAVKEGVSFHMNHERYAGIIPKFFQASDHSTLKKAYQQQIAEEPDAKLKGFDNAHLVKTAQFMFFKFRFSGRVMQLTLRYSPQLVTGLPCLVLDPDDSNRSRFIYDTEGKDGPVRSKKKDPDFNTGTHYFGVIASLQHVLDAGGGAQTRVTLTDCRTHTEASEIFGGGDDFSTYVHKSYTSKKKVSGEHKAEITGGTVNRNSIDTDPEKILGADYDPSAKYVVDVKYDNNGNQTYTHFDAGYESSTGHSAEDHPRQDLNKKKAYVPSANPIPYAPSIITDPEGENFAHIATQFRVPATFVNVYAVKKGTRSKKVDFTFEGIVTPPWYSSCFLPGNIGIEYYQKLVGCRSVVDDPAIRLNATAQAQYEQHLRDDGENESKTDGSTGDENTQYLEIYHDFEKYDEEAYTTTRGSVFVPKSLLSKAKSATYAAEYLAETWLGLKEMNTDINRYIDTYVDRSYATMLDIFGNQNEHLVISSNMVMSKYSSEKVDGFHGYAYGKYEKLENLEGAGQRLTKADQTSKVRSSVREEIDTRKEKYTAVMLYKNSLQGTAKQEQS